MEQQMGCTLSEEEQKHEFKNSQPMTLHDLINQVRLKLEGSSSLNPYDAFHNISQILLKGKEKLGEDHQNIEELISYWNEFDLEDLYNNEDVTSKKHYKFYQVWMLTARVLLKVQEFIKKLQFKKKFQHQDYKGVQKISEYMYKQQLEYSPEKNLLTKKSARYTFRSYHVTNYTTEKKQESQTGHYFINKIYEIAKTQSIKFVLILFEFLANIGVITLEGVQPAIENEFMENLNRIHKRQQRQLFLTNYNCQHFEQMKHCVKEKDTDELKRIIVNVFPNYGFYKNEVKAGYKDMNLEKLHQKYRDYYFLEGVHDYIQWMFPNHYGSAFNSRSKPLNYIQSELFQKDSFVQLSLFKSILIFTDFMGLKLNFQTKSFTIISKKRLSDVILVNYHNHLRLMRILACLSVTGFRSLALSLIKFLDENTQPNQYLEKQRHEFQNSWKIYGEQTLQKAKQMCFLEKAEFEEKQSIVSYISCLDLAEEIQNLSKEDIQLTENNININKKIRYLKGQKEQQKQQKGAKMIEESLKGEPEEAIREQQKKKQNESKATTENKQISEKVQKQVEPSLPDIEKNQLSVKVQKGKQ